MMKLQMLKQAMIAYVANSVKAIWSAVAHPLTIVGKKNCNVADYRIYGNSVQNGEPTPDAPVEIQSVGDYDATTGKYKVPITVSGKNIFKPYRVSTKTIRTVLPPELTNEYGTTIDTTDLSDNSVKVTQVPNENSSADSYKNGYICIQTEGLTVGKKYRFSFDIDILENPLKASSFHIYPGGQYPNTRALFSSTKQRVTCVFTEKLPTQARAYPGLEIRCMGISFTASNFMITEADITDTEYEPYVEPKNYELLLDEPLRRLGNHEDYIDFKNGKVVRKCVKIYLTKYNPLWNPDLDSDVNYGFTANDNSILPRNGKDNIEDNYGYSNMFKFVNTNSNGNLIDTITLNNYGRNVRVYVDKARLSDGTVETFRQWINENNPYQIRVRDAVKEEPINLPTLPQFKGTTVYEAQTEIPPSGIEVQYYG